jgi:hypothetical protein
MHWFFDDVHGVWHLWPQLYPVNGDPALCGYVKDENCTPNNGSDVPVRCPDCVVQRRQQMA